MAWFFALAFVSWFSDLPAHECAIKGLIGAGIMYVVLTVAMKLIVSIMVSTIIRSSSEAQEGTRTK